MTISNSDDIIDSRAVIARIEELVDYLNNLTGDDVEAADDERDELAKLKALAEEGAGCADWRCGETLIRDSYFREYAEQLADDLDLLRGDAQWPYTCIDWERAARELRMDYTSIDFDGVTYWARS